MVKFGGKKARKHLKFIYLYKIFYGRQSDLPLYSPSRLLRQQVTQVASVGRSCASAAVDNRVRLVLAAILAAFLRADVCTVARQAHYRLLSVFQRAAHTGRRGMHFRKLLPEHTLNYGVIFYGDEPFVVVGRKSRITFPAPLQTLPT